jgi:hypothetical protein
LALAHLNTEDLDEPSCAVVAVFAVGAVGAVVASCAVFAVCVVVVCCCPERFVNDKLDWYREAGLHVA